MSPRMFHNRHREVRELLDGVGESLADGHTALTALWGMSGIGKSSLAVHVAHLLRSTVDFHGGQLYYELGGSRPGEPVAPGTVLRHFLRQLDVAVDPDAGLSELSTQFRSRVADAPVLIVLDDAASAAQVRPVLPAGRGAVIVTSVRRLDGLRLDDFTLMEVPPFTDEQGGRMLADVIGRDRLDSEPEAARRLVDGCGGLPLRLSLMSTAVAARRHSPLSGFVDRLSRDVLTGPRVPGEDSWADHIDRWYHVLDEESAHLYRVLGTLPGTGFDVGLVAALIDTDRDDALDRLDTLVAATFIRQVSPDRFRLHDLIAAHAARRARDELDEAERARLSDLRLGYYRTRAVALSLVVVRRPLIGGFAEGVEPAHTGPDAVTRALDELEAEADNLRAVVSAAAGAGADETVVAICQALKPWYYDTDRHAELLELSGLAVAAAERLTDRPGLAVRAHHDLGSVCEALGRFDEALVAFERSRALARAVGDRRAESSAVEAIGLVAEQTGDTDRALACFAEALRLVEPLADPARSVALLTMHRGRVLVARDEVEAGRHALTTARVYFSDRGEAVNEGRCLELLAATHGEDHPTVIGLLSTALELFTAARFVSKQAETHARLARCHHALAAVTEAVRHATAARDLFDRLGRLARVAEMVAYLNTLGR